MEWIFDNLKLVIFAVVIVAYAIKAMREKNESEGNPPATRQRPDAAGDPAEAERTRQIQEEIRRRILARQRGEVPPTSPPLVVVHETPPVETYRESTPLPPPVPRPAPAPVSAYDQSSDDTAILDAQRALEEQFRLVKEMRQAATAGVPGLHRPSSTGGTGSGQRISAAQRGLRKDLAAPTSLRRAIMLREILGEPVALRTGPLPRR